MVGLIARRAVTGAVVSVVALLASMAAAPRSVDAADAVFPAGQACPFPLGLESTGESTVFREFQDNNGDIVQFSVGTGLSRTFSNVTSGESLALPVNGAVSRTTFEADGSLTIVGTGHTLVWLQASDPEGPSMRLYVGRLVYTVDTDLVLTIQDANGSFIDICEALSP